MFLIDKYYYDSNFLLCYKTLIEKILKSFDRHKIIYDNVKEIIKLPNEEFKNIINNLNYETYRYANFQHLIVYGTNGSCKEYLINKLLEQIYGKSNIELHEVEYIVSGYSNTKTKITIKQSKYHIIIEPNYNGFDKYIIQEIIYEYAKSEILNILTYTKLFKIIIINKIDNLSYYAQASLRRTMEKYSNTCKFILLCDQLAKIIEPLRSRCLLIRIPLPTEEQILETLLYISYKENISISIKDLYSIVKKSDYIINHAIWLLEMYTYKINYDNNWTNIIDDIVNLIYINKINTHKQLYNTMKKIREKFYLLFITNISTHLIIRKIMITLLYHINNINIKYNVIEITSIFEQRLNQGTRHIIQFEAYILKLIQLFTNNKKDNYKFKILSN